MDKEIVIPIYYVEEDNGKKIVDEDSVREEFEYKLEDAIKNINNLKIN